MGQSEVDFEHDQPLTQTDIIALGIEAGLRVQAMPEFPDAKQRQAAVDELGMSAVKRAYTPLVNPEEVI